MQTRNDEERWNICQNKIGIAVDEMMDTGAKKQDVAGLLLLKAYDLYREESLEGMIGEFLKKYKESA